MADYSNIGVHMLADDPSPHLFEAAALESLDRHKPVESSFTKVIFDHSKSFGDNRLAAIEATTEKYATWIDSDDLVVNDGFRSLQKSLVANPSAAVAFSLELLIDEQGNPQQLQPAVWTEETAPPITYRDLISRVTFAHHLVMLDRSRIDEEALYFARVFPYVEWPLICYLAFKYGAVRVPQICYHWRKHSESLTFKHDGSPRVVREYPKDTEPVYNWQDTVRERLLFTFPSVDLDATIPHFWPGPVTQS